MYNSKENRDLNSEKNWGGQRKQNYRIRKKQKPVMFKQLKLRSEHQKLKKTIISTDGSNTLTRPEFVVFNFLDFGFGPGFILGTSLATC